MRTNSTLLNKNGKTNGFPTYKDDVTMFVGGWDEPINTLDDYKFAKDMGLNHIFIGGVFAKLGTEGSEKVLKMCDQAGLKALITVGNALHTEFAKDSWANDKTDYSAFPAVSAINIWDEPWLKNFDRVAELVDEHIAKYGDKLDFFVNHFPNTAEGAFGGLSYDEFIGEYVDKILLKAKEGHRYLSADIYPLELRDGKSFIRENWLSCIETISTHGKRAKALTHFFILSTEHDGDFDLHYRAPNEDDIRWQIFVNFAFGIKGYSFFTYRDSFCKGFSTSCVRKDLSCSPHEMYFQAKRVNAEIAAFSNVYLSFDWLGTMPVIGKNNSEKQNGNFKALRHSLKKVDGLTAVSATEDALIGRFSDKDGNVGLIVTNFTDPYLKLENEISLTFDNADRVRVFDKGEVKDYSLVDNTFVFTLGCGEGVFMIPMKADA